VHKGALYQSADLVKSPEPADMEDVLYHGRHLNFLKKGNKLV
jgi:hypothetical protein